MRSYGCAKRDPIKNYFPLPNEIFVLGLNAGEIAVYAYLLFCENRKTFQCWPSCRSPRRSGRSGLPPGPNDPAKKKILQSPRNLV